MVPFPFFVRGDSQEVLGVGSLGLKATLSETWPNCEDLKAWCSEGHDTGDQTWGLHLQGMRSSLLSAQVRLFVWVSTLQCWEP